MKLNWYQKLSAFVKTIYLVLRYGIKGAKSITDRELAELHAKYENEMDLTRVPQEPYSVICLFYTPSGCQPNIHSHHNKYQLTL